MRKLNSWQKILLAGAGVIFSILSCSQRSLVLVDVHAPQGMAYTNVTVILKVAGTQSTTFDKVTFDASGIFKAGVYVPSDMTGSVGLHAEVDDANCVLGSGDASTTITAEGETTMAADLPITPSSVPCVPGTGGSGSATGGAGGMMASGGSVGSGGSAGLSGTAGAGGVLGSGGVGAGGVAGSGGVTGTGGKGGVTGSGGVTGTGGHGSGGATGTGGSPTTGAGGSPTTGAGGSPTTGAGGSPTTGSGGIIGSGGVGGLGGGGTIGSGGIGGGVTGSGGVGTGGGSGCACPAGFVCLPGTTTCVCSQTDAQACANAACGSVTNTCQQTVNCPDTCPVGYSCSGNFCKQLTTTGCGGSIVATGTGLVAGSSAAAPICP